MNPIDLIDESKDFLLHRQQAYVQTFGQDGALVEVVLKDLENFCRGVDSTFHPEARVHALLEGRREVWLRIQDHLKLSSEELWEKYNGKTKRRMK